MKNKAIYCVLFTFVMAILSCGSTLAVTPTPSPTPTSEPSPTPIAVTPYATAPSWSTFEYEIDGNDVNAYDCGSGHDGNDHLFSITVPTSAWCVIEVRAKDDESLDLDFGFQQMSVATPHETKSNIGCWDYLGRQPIPTATPNGADTPTPNPTPHEPYGMYWSSFSLLTYLESGENYYFWVGGHETSDQGEYQMRVYYDDDPPDPPTPTLTPEPTCTP